MNALAKQRYQRVRIAVIAYAKAARKPRKKALQEWLNSLKEGRPCMDCGGVFPPWCMDFDHREGEVKLYKGVSDLMANRLCGKQRILAEIAKCDLVCANCHRTRTHFRLLKTLTGS
jgi:hypothetical protein